MGTPVEAYHKLLQAHMASRLGIYTLLNLLLPGHPRYTPIEDNWTEIDARAQKEELAETPNHYLCFP